MKFYYSLAGQCLCVLGTCCYNGYLRELIFVLLCLIIELRAVQAWQQKERDTRSLSELDGHLG